MTIEFYVKNVYGRDQKYVKDQAQAKAINEITRQETLQQNVENGLRALGFEFKEVLPPRGCGPNPTDCVMGTCDNPDCDGNIKV